MPYCFVCPACAMRQEHAQRDGNHCSRCDHWSLKRDYRAENVRVGGPVLFEARRERANKLASRADILPTAKDYESPTDPTGERGMQTWMEEHTPRDDNKHPKWPTRSERSGV